MRQIKRFFKDEEGLELSEYAVMAALVIGAIIVTVTLLGTNISTRFDTLADTIAG